MRILPVLDLKTGLIVRGIAGRRDKYRPVVSGISSSAEPRQVAEAFRDQFGLNNLYLADLDAIAGSAPALSLYVELIQRGFHLWVDAGIQQPGMTAPLVEAGVEGIVVGLETIAGPEALAAVCRDLGKRVVFSLDLKAGKPLGNLHAWEKQDAWSIAAQAVAMGVQHLIVLDLARVGMDGGTGTEALCARLAESYPHVEIVAGGGVRDIADLHRLRQIGVGGVLVASALHDGRLSREDLACPLST